MLHSQLVVYGCGLRDCIHCDVQGCFTHSNFFQAPLRLPVALVPRLSLFLLLLVDGAVVRVVLSMASGRMGLMLPCCLRGGL